MSSLPLLRIAIAGEWSDGWLYKDHLFLWDADGNLLQASTDQLLAELRSSQGEEVALAAQIALFRNDWKSGTQMSAFARVGRIHDAMRYVAQAAAGVTEPIKLSTSSFQLVAIEPIPGFLLSVSIYGNHAFLASSEGLFETNVNPKYLDREQILLHRLDVPVHDVETNYGAVAASAFEDGLWFDRIDFGETGSWTNAAPMEQIADYSRAISMASTNLLNFTDEPLPDLYIGKTDRGYQNSQSRYLSTSITGFRRTPETLSVLSAQSLGMPKDRIWDGGIRLIANAKQRLLYNVDGSLQILRLKTFDGIKLERVVDLKIQWSDAADEPTPISSHPIGNGFLIESFDRVTWVGKEGVVNISNTPVVNVRTFPNSRHFDEAALIIEDDQAVLIGTLNFPHR